MIKLKHILSLVAALTALASTARAGMAPEIDLDGGRLVFDATGAMSYRSAQGEVNIAAGYYAPGWSPRTQWKLGPDRVSMETKGEQHWVWTNTFKQSGEASATLTQEVKVHSSAEEGAEVRVQVDYRLEVGPGFRFEESSRGPFVEAVMPAESSTGQSVKVAGKTVNLPANNVWAYGDSAVFPAWNLQMNADRGMSASVWKVAKGGGSSVRFALKAQDEGGEGPTVYEASFTLK